MQIAFGKKHTYDRADLVVVAIGMGLYLSAATLNQAALARGQVRRASFCWVGCAIAFVIWTVSRSSPATSPASSSATWAPRPCSARCSTGSTGSRSRPRSAVKPGSTEEMELQLASARRGWLAATRPLHFGAEGEARSDLCGAAACGRDLMAPQAARFGAHSAASERTYAARPLWPRSDGEAVLSQVAEHGPSRAARPGTNIASSLRSASTVPIATSTSPARRTVSRRTAAAGPCRRRCGAPRSWSSPAPLRSSCPRPRSPR